MDTKPGSLYGFPGFLMRLYTHKGVCVSEEEKRDKYDF